MAAKQKTIELTEPHTHAGRDYTPGSVITMDADSADWLIGLKRAKEAPKSARPENADSDA